MLEQIRLYTWQVWSGGGGHSVAWEYDDNNVTVYDAQTNSEYSLANVTPYIDAAEWYRTDNTDFTDKAVSNVVDKKNKDTVNEYDKNRIYSRMMG